MKGRLPGKPLVDGDGQSILVAGRAGLALELFRGHIGDGADDLGLERGKGARGWGGEAEVAQQQFVVIAQQHILRLDISVDLPGTVCIVQGGGSLACKGEDGRERELTAFRVALAQSAIGGVMHDEERSAIMDITFEDAHDMGMLKTRDGPHLREEALHMLVVESCAEELQCNLCAQIGMLSKVDIGEATTAQQGEQAIAAELLPGIIVHRLTLLTNIRDNRRIVPKRVDIYGHRTFCLICPVETASRTG